MTGLQARFNGAAAQAQTLARRPGLMDLVGRAKFDSRSQIKGCSQEEAMRAYIELVEELKKG